MKYAYIAQKITGGNSKENGMFQLGIIIEQDNKIVDKFFYYFKPHQDIKYDEKFLKLYEKQGITMDAIMNRTETEQFVYEKLINFLGKYVNRFNGKDRLFFVGYNVCSSFEFFKELSKRNNDNLLKYFWSNPLDLMTLAGEFFKQERACFDNFSFRTVLKTFQDLEAIEKTISIDENTALWEAAMIYKMYKRLRTENIDETVNFLNSKS